MYNANKPDAAELPSTAKLLKSTGVAAAVASALLVTVVLPAEYGVDPTRIGSVLGLTEMGRIKVQLAAEAEAEEKAAAEAEASGSATAANLLAPEALAAPARPASATSAPAAAGQEQQTVVVLAPDQGAEIKLVMRNGASARYRWSTDGGRINYDTHGDGAGVKYHAYGKGSSTGEQGVLTAALDGSHGWFWRNRTGGTVTVTLITSGDYTEIKRFD
jgi:hypothetical protein